MKLLLLLLIAVSNALSSEPQQYLCETLDAVLMFDTSQSITPERFREIRNYAVDLVSHWSMGTGMNQAQFAGILFNDDVRYSWKLGELNVKRQLTERIQTLPYVVGTTDYQNAFTVAQKMLAHARPHSCKAAILFSDGWLNKGELPTSSVAQMRSGEQAKIVAIAARGLHGMDDSYDRSTLEKLTGDASMVFALDEVSPKDAYKHLTKK